MEPASQQIGRRARRRRKSPAFSRSRVDRRNVLRQEQKHRRHRRPSPTPVRLTPVRRRTATNPRENVFRSAGRLTSIASSCNSIQRLYLLTKRLTACLETRELIEAGASGREYHRIARTSDIRSRRHRASERPCHLDIRSQKFGEKRPRLANENGLRRELLNRGNHLAQVAAFVLAARDHEEPSARLARGLQRRIDRRRVRAHRVVDPANAIPFGHNLHPMRDARKLRESSLNRFPRRCQTRALSSRWRRRSPGCASPESEAFAPAGSPRRTTRAAQGRNRRRTKPPLGRPSSKPPCRRLAGRAESWLCRRRNRRARRSDPDDPPRG